MIYELHRYGLRKKSTLGGWMAGDRRLCHTLEDGYNEPKIPGETCIPEGRYRLGLHKEGKFHASYGALFPDIHKGMIHLLDVPNFLWILVHCGNTVKDTRGCIIVGRNPIVDSLGNWEVNQSRYTYRSMYPEVIASILREPTWLEVMKVA